MSCVRLKSGKYHGFGSFGPCIVLLTEIKVATLPLVFSMSFVNVVDQAPKLNLL